MDRCRDREINSVADRMPRFEARLLRAPARNALARRGVGNLAPKTPFETYRHIRRPRDGGETVRTSGKLMRILQRQQDGSWKIHRSIATVDPPTV
jgi:hypothetical protein